MKSETPRARLCGCLMEASLQELPALLCHPDADLLEMRLDGFAARHGIAKTREMLSLLSISPRNVVMATNRHRRDGGLFEGDEEERVLLLLDAAAAGVDWIDLEDYVSEELTERFKSMKRKVLISYHDFSGTPSGQDLRGKLAKMAQSGADAAKIVTLARSPEDNLRVLELIPIGKKEFNVDVIAFCMGALGRWSRIACLLLGSPWTYVQLPGQTAAAPGQVTAAEMRSLLELMGVSG